jgi:hypothetical protein
MFILGACAVMEAITIHDGLSTFPVHQSEPTVAG